MKPLTTIDALWYARMALGEWTSTQVWATRTLYDPHTDETFSSFSGALAYRLVPIGEPFNVGSSGQPSRYPDFVQLLPVELRNEFERRRQKPQPATATGFHWGSRPSNEELLDRLRLALVGLGNPPNPEWTSATRSGPSRGQRLVDLLDSFICLREQIGGPAVEPAVDEQFWSAKADLVRAFDEDVK